MAKRKRKPSRIEPSAFKEIAGKVVLSGKELRRLAEEDYITDADAHSIEWHFRRKDRPYQKAMSGATFLSWARAGRWRKRRLAYWRVIQERLLKHLQDKILDQRIKDLDTMVEIRTAVSEHLVPLKDESGEIIRDDRGLPKFSTELPAFDKLVRSFLDLDLRISLKTGEVDSAAGTERGAAAGTDPVVRSGKIHPDEARSLARRLLLEKNTSLAEALGGMDAGAAAAEEPL